MTDWGGIFDVLSKEYGWTTEYIASRTRREIDWRVRKLVARTKMDVQLQARLHDKELKSSSAEETPDVVLGEEEKKAIERNQAEALKRIGARKAKRG